MNTLSFIVDFSGSLSKEDVILRLVDVMKLPNDPEWKWNWDAFADYFTSLDSDSDIVREAIPMPAHVHLVVKNIEAVKALSLRDYQLLLDVLEQARDPECRSDGITFTYEIAS